VSFAVQQQSQQMLWVRGNPWQTTSMEINLSQLKMEGLVAIVFASMEARHL